MPGETNPTGGTGTAGFPTNIYNSSQYPVWAQQLGLQSANQISSMMDAYGQLGQGNNWYNGPLVAGESPLQQQAVRGAQMPFQWQGGLSQAAGALSDFSQPYNQWELQQYMNPYTQGVVSEIGRLGRDKLNDDMNSINSTFTSGGGFGGTRNRSAILDAQQRNSREVLGAQRTALDNAYDTANQNYFQWAGRPLQAATAWGNLAGMGSNLNWNDINNQYAIGQKGQATEQAGMDAAYKDYITRMNAPLSALAQLQQMAGNVTGLYKPNTTQTSQTTVPQIGDAQTAIGGLGVLDRLLQGLGVYG